MNQVSYELRVVYYYFLKCILKAHKMTKWTATKQRLRERIAAGFLTSVSENTADVCFCYGENTSNLLYFTHGHFCCGKVRSASLPLNRWHFKVLHRFEPLPVWSSQIRTDVSKESLSYRPNSSTKLASFHVNGLKQHRRRLLPASGCISVRCPCSPLRAKNTWTSASSSSSFRSSVYSSSVRCVFNLRAFGRREFRLVFVNELTN